MTEKRTPLEKEEPKHRKKSKKKGQPRADHKHEYKTVLLYRYYNNPFKQGEKCEHKQPVKVCSVCGRVGDVDSSRYERTYAERNGKKLFYIDETINESGLEKWYIEDYLDKFAKRMDDVGKIR